MKLNLGVQPYFAEIDILVVNCICVCSLTRWCIGASWLFFCIILSSSKPTLNQDGLGTHPQGYDPNRSIGIRQLSPCDPPKSVVKIAHPRVGGAWGVGSLE